jgi:ParB-like nuclease family protein
VVSDDAQLVRWLAPSQSSQIDLVALTEVHDGWTPSRVGELPIAAAIAVIRSVGIVDPVLLRPAGEGYEVVSGHRTVAAARLAGLQRVPAIVRKLDDGQALMAMALDGSATGSLTPDSAEELRARMVGAGLGAEDIEDVMVAVPIGAPVAEAPAVPQPAPAPQPEVATARWIPLPSGEPRLARLSSAFADSPRMLELLAADGFTGTVELAGPDGRRDAITFLEGQCVAATVEEGGQRVAAPLRLPAPERGPVVEITVRPHPPTVVVALALALRGPARLVGLDASFLHLDGLIRKLAERGRDAAIVVAAPRGAGVILLSGGEPIAAYARREGEEPGEAAETTDVTAVAELLADGRGEVDVHDGPLVEPIDLAALIAGATPGS